MPHLVMRRGCDTMEEIHVTDVTVEGVMFACNDTQEEMNEN